MHEEPPLFKILTDFYVHKFDESTSLVCPTICNNARSANVKKGHGWQAHEVNAFTMFANFIMYLKHDNVISYESFH